MTLLRPANNSNLKLYKKAVSILKQEIGIIDVIVQLCFGITLGKSAQWRALYTKTTRGLRRNLHVIETTVSK